MKPSVDQCRYLLSLAEAMLDDLDDSHRALEPGQGMKTAGWLIGHLATSGDYARVLCGRTALCPPTWPGLFHPGTRPSTDPDRYPSMAALCEAFRLVYADLCVAAMAPEGGPLTAVNPFAPARAGFPTAGDFVAYLSSSHLAYHLGQLAAWRAAGGLGPARRSDRQAA